MKSPEERVLEEKASEEEEYKKFLEKLIKTNREIILLSLIQEKPMCGYDLIKEILQRCNVYISQGTIYPVLYSLEEEGILHAEFGRGNIRTKRYLLTPDGKEIAERRLEGFAKALEYLLFMVKR
jgi:DNA-binding PadR family transcriptional regulator